MLLHNFGKCKVSMSWLEVPLPALLAVQVLQIVVVTSPVLLLLLLLLSAPLLLWLLLLHVVVVPVSHYLLPANLTTNIFIQARIFLRELKIFPKFIILEKDQ